MNRKGCRQWSGGEGTGEDALPHDWGRAGAGACRVQPSSDRAVSRSQLCLAAAPAAALVLAGSAAVAQTATNPVEIPFVGNSFTHGRYAPALNYSAGPGNAANNDVVHDLLCPSLNASGACTSGAGAVAPVTPTAANTPGGSVLGQLGYLQGNPSAQYTEPGPFGGVAGVFLQFTKEAQLHYNVSLVAVSSATLQGYLNNTGSTAGTLPLIASAKYDQVIMQDQSFRPLPTTITVNGQSVPTRGNPAGFQSGVNGLVNAIDNADAATGKANAAITLYQTQPLASYGYTSSNPSAPIFGSSTAAQNGGNPAFAPYVGAANPIAQMASDLHNAYTNAANTYNGANPAKSHVNVALAGDAWVSAINLGIAVQNPYLTNNPVNRVNLWDSNPLTACCTTPIGYHPSSYGVYLNALSIFYRITGIDPVTLDAETNASNPLFQSSAAHALGISATDAQLLAIAASDTIRAGMPVSSFELETGTIRAVLGGSGGLIKDGPSTVTLTALNTYTGGTAINGGVLQVDGSVAASSQTVVNGGATLTGSGTVGSTTINPGGLFAPGNGTAGSSMTVSGNLALQSGAAYLVQLNTAGASFAKVTGPATLGGATVNAVLAPGSDISKRYTILSAAGGISGAFAPVAVTNLPANVRTALSYDATHAFLDLNLSFDVPGGRSGNQQSVGTALSSFFNRNGSIPSAFGALTAGALTQASGETAAGSQQTTFNAMTQFMGIITDPFVEGRGSTSGPATGASAYADDDQAGVPAGRSRGLGDTERDAYAVLFAKAPRRESHDAPWSVWAAGFGGRQTTDGNPVLGSSNTISSIAGTAVGADYRFSPSTAGGFALAGGGTSFSVAGGGTGRSDLFQAGAFVRHTMGSTYISGALAYGWQEITTDRSVTITGIDQLRAQFSANAFSGRAEGGSRFMLATGGIGITPYAAAQLTLLDLPAYAEQVVSGANTFALAYGSTSVTATRSELGVRADTSRALGDAVLALRGRLAWAHDFNPDRNVAATFQTLPGASFVVNGATQASDSALTSASVEMKWLNGWSAAVTFEGEVSDVTSSYAGKGIVRYVW